MPTDVHSPHFDLNMFWKNFAWFVAFPDLWRSRTWSRNRSAASGKRTSCRNACRKQRPYLECDEYAQAWIKRKGRQQDIIVLQNCPGMMILQDLCKQPCVPWTAAVGIWMLPLLPHCMQLLEVTIEDSDQEHQRSEREADELRKQLAETSADTRHCFGTETARQRRYYEEWNVDFVWFRMIS